MKRLIISIVVLFFITMVSEVTFGASDKCTIVSIDEKQMVIECDKPEKKFKVGDKLKIKSIKSRQQIEGC